MNFSMQYYRGIPLKLVDRDYREKRAKRYCINNTNQNVWIPNTLLLLDGTIRPNRNLEFIFATYNNRHILELAGVKYGQISRMYYVGNEGN